ncbi:ATP-grasp domain-containing protein [Elusimicrobiota bacterium]
MRLYEYESKKLCKRMGLSIPRQYGIIRKPSQINCLSIKFPCMLKAMVLSGGRGKAGGISKAGSLSLARIQAGKILGIYIDGSPVNSLLVEEAIDRIDGSCYIGITVDPATFNNAVIVSAAGGVDIEETARSRADSIWRKEITENSMELPLQISRAAARFLNRSLKGSLHLEKRLMRDISALYALYQKYDCKVAEINPLIITRSKTIAADAKIVMDDNALYRQWDILKDLGICGKRHDMGEATANEERARKSGIPYVDLLPESLEKEPDKLYVGLVPGGAGYGIFSIDEVVNIGNHYFKGKAVPVNFMDSGGGPSINKVIEMFNILMDHEMVDIIITSRFGGISSCDVFIRALVVCLRQRYERNLVLKPVFGRMVGTDLPGARAFLEKALKDTPDALKGLKMIAGNREIFARVMRRAIKEGFELKKGRL